MMPCLTTSPESTTIQKGPEPLKLSQNKSVLP
ncbi:mCG148267, partial [Mus musculus]